MACRRGRGLGFVFQGYALFEHMTVARNIAFGRHVRRPRPPRHEVAAAVERMLALVRLPGLGDRLPSQLSGGQRQRVALARTLAVEPRILLLDEPFGALDRQVREELRGELRRIHDALGMTTLFVTHDHEEALALADRALMAAQPVRPHSGSLKIAGITGPGQVREESLPSASPPGEALPAAAGSWWRGQHEGLEVGRGSNSTASRRGNRPGLGAQGWEHPMGQQRGSHGRCGDGRGPEHSPAGKPILPRPGPAQAANRAGFGGQGRRRSFKRPDRARAGPGTHRAATGTRSCPSAAPSRTGT